jgi:hypothetical protein
MTSMRGLWKEKPLQADEAFNRTIIHVASFPNVGGGTVSSDTFSASLHGQNL